MPENRISPEKFYTSLNEIKSKISNAISITGLPSSLSLCHYINYSIALKLQNDFGLPINEYGFGKSASFSQSKPQIGYVANANLDTGHSKVKHSFLIVFGVEESPILIDGANDQADPTNPFLIARLGKSDYSSVEYSLKRLKHPIKELGFIERNQGNKLQTIFITFLQKMVNEKIITQQDINDLRLQFDKEASIGLNFLFFGMNRDWLTYFAKSLGIHYPTLQHIQEAFFKYSESKGVKIPQNFDNPELKEQLEQTMLRLKAEGMI